MESADAMRILADVYDDLEDQGVTIRSTRDTTASISGEVVVATVEIEIPFDEAANGPEPTAIETVPPQTDPLPHRPQRQTEQFPDVEAETAVDNEADGQDDQQSDHDTTEDSEAENTNPEAEDTNPQTDPDVEGTELGTYQVSDYGLSLSGDVTDTLGEYDRVTCRPGDEHPVITPGASDDHPDYKATPEKIQIGRPGLRALGLESGDEIELVRDGDVILITTDGLEDEQDLPSIDESELPEWIDEHPGAIVAEAPTNRSVDEVLDAAVTCDSLLDVYQRLALDGVNQAHRLLDDLGLRTPGGSLREDASERVDELREVIDE
jgi:hypothetical protein